MTPTLARITLFPIKSLDGVDVTRAEVLPGGALRHDREYALVDGAGAYVNGKRFPEIHRIRSGYQLDAGRVELGISGFEEVDGFDLEADRGALEDWFSAYFGFSVRLLRDPAAGHPDDRKYPGPTVISSATLEAVAAWFIGLSADDLRLRLRMNLELGGTDVFAEDRLFAGPDEAVTFRVGGVVFEGGNPCRRCVVPTRDPRNGAVYPDFQATFMRRREATLAPGVARERFDHFYRLGVNTRIRDPGPGAVLEVGAPFAG